MGDFRSALQNEKETYTIYKIQVSISGFINNICSINYIIGHFRPTECIFSKVGRGTRENKRIVRMPSTPNAAGSCAAEKDE